MRNILTAIAVAALAAEVWAVQGTIVTESSSMTGNITYQRRQKTYSIEVKKGKNTVQSEFPAAEVTKLDIPKPAGFDKAVEQVENGQGAQAIPALTKIVNDYYMLNWDKAAGKYLVRAYCAAGQAQKGMEICQGIINEDKSAAYTGDLAPAYWLCLLKLNKTDMLERCLAKAASAGSRQASAAALIMRGDIIVDAGGDVKQALRDGYLRVALMYGDCPDEKREALLKAANCFDKLGQASRAERLRAQTK